jgi:hypothetical protein
LQRRVDLVVDTIFSPEDGGRVFLGHVSIYLQFHNAYNQQDQHRWFMYCTCFSDLTRTQKPTACSAPLNVSAWCVTGLFRIPSTDAWVTQRSHISRSQAQSVTPARVAQVHLSGLPNARCHFNTKRTTLKMKEEDLNNNGMNPTNNCNLFWKHTDFEVCTKRTAS